MTKVKEILRFSFFILLGHLGQMAFNFSDLFVCSRYSSMASGALSVANGIFALALVAGLGLTIAISSLVSFHRSKSNQNVLPAEYLSTYFLVSALASILLIFLLLLSLFFIDQMNIDPKLIPGILSYLKITANSLLPAILFSCFKEFLQGHEKTFFPNALIIFFNLINFGLNWVLVNGLGPFPEMGVSGAAWATVICRWSMFIFLFLYMHVTFFKKKLTPKYFHFNRELGMELLKMGLPLTGNILLEVGVFSTTTILSSSFGVVSAASHGIVLNLISMAFMFPLSISSAASVKIAYEKGQNNYSEAKKTIYASLFLVTIMASFLSILFIFYPERVVGLLTKDSEVITLGAKILLIAGCFQIADGFQVTTSGLLRGLGETRFPMYFYAINYWLIGLPLGTLLGIYHSGGVKGLWIGLMSAVYLMALTNGPYLYYFFHKAARINGHNVTSPQSPNH